MRQQYSELQKESEHRPFKTGHWTKDEGENIKIFFENIANNKGIDSSVRENWYSLQTSDLLDEPV